MGMILALSLRLVYLIFEWLLDWLTMIARSSSSKDSTCKPSSKTWASAPPDRQHLVDQDFVSV
jgi:hypothetical protein